MSLVSVQDVEIILEKVSFVSEYVGDCDDWVTVKKQVLLNLPPIVRKNFSTRDSKTKEQWLNDFEKDLIIYYKELTGIDLVLRTLDERREMFDVL